MRVRSLDRPLNMTAVPQEVIAEVIVYSLTRQCEDNTDVWYNALTVGKQDLSNRKLKVGRGIGQQGTINTFGVCQQRSGRQGRIVKVKPSHRYY